MHFRLTDRQARILANMYGTGKTWPFPGGRDDTKEALVRKGAVEKLPSGRCKISAAGEAALGAFLIHEAKHHGAQVVQFARARAAA